MIVIIIYMLSKYKLLTYYTFALFVIPAKAGIQKPWYYWIPAFAGMTSEDYKIIYISIGYSKVQKYTKINNIKLIWQLIELTILNI